MTRTTKIVVFLGIAVLLMVAVFAGLNYFFPAGEKSDGGLALPRIFPSGGALAPGKTPAGGEGTAAPESEPAKAKVVQITKEAIAGATLDQDGAHLLYFKRAGGNLFRAGLDGAEEEHLSNLTILGIHEVKWAPDKKTAVVRYLDEEGAAKTFLFDVASSTTLFLPQSITSIGWSPDGKTLAYTEKLAEGSRVATSDILGKNIKTVFTSVIPDLGVKWQAQNTLLVSTPPSYAAKNISFLVTLGKPASEFISGTGMSILPSLATSTKNMLFLTSVSKEGVVNFSRFANLGRLASSTSAATLAEKCVWSQTGPAIYCAVPTNSLASSRLPDDWYRGKVLFTDDFVKINPFSLETNTSALEGTFDATELFLTPDERFLFFINKRDGNLWRADVSDLGQ